MKDQDLYLLTHLEKWPHGMQLPVMRRGGDPVRNVKDAGIVLNNNLKCVWSNVYLGDDTFKGTPLYYKCPEHLFTEWEID